MFRFNRIVCVLFVCCIVGIAYGKAIKVTELVAVDNENPTADGMVILNYNQGQARTEIQIAITDFEPDTDYKILVSTIFGGVIASVTTNPSGNAQAHRIAITDITDNGNACADVKVFFDTSGNGDYDVGIDELRAEGTNCP